MKRFSAIALALGLGLAPVAAFAAECPDGGQQQAAVKKDGSNAPMQQPKDPAGVTGDQQGTTQNFDKAKAEAGSGATAGKDNPGSQIKDGSAGKPC